MKINKQDSYTKHGCNFKGNLLVIDYSEDWKMHPDYGKFASMSIFDVVDKAKKLLLAEYPNAEILLDVPDIVAVHKEAS